MTFPKYSANKKSASYDLKKAFLQMLVPAGIMMFLGLVLLIDIRLEFSYHLVIKDAVSNLMPEEYTLISVVCVLMGAVFALFDFMGKSKNNANFYFSLPVDRSTIFKNRMIAAVTYIAGILFVVIAFDYLINIHTIKCYGFLFKMAFWLYLEMLVYILAGFVIMTIGIAASHTVVEGIFGGLGLLFLPYSLLRFFDSVFGAFLSGYAITGSYNSYFYDSYRYGFYHESLVDTLAQLNPFTLGARIGGNYSQDTIFSLAHSDYDYAIAATYNNGINGVITIPDEYKAVLPDWTYIVPLVCWALLMAAGIFLAGNLFVNRKAEHAGIHGMNPVMTSIFTVSFGTGLFSYLIYNIGKIIENEATTYIIIVGIVIGLAVLMLITLAICQRKFIYKIKKLYYVPFSTAVFTLILLLILHFGGFGYTNYVPSADDVEMATITSLSIVDDVHNEMAADYMTMADNFPDTGFVILKEQEDIEKLIAVHKGIKSPDVNSEYNSVDIVYLLKNGKKVYRRFNVADAEGFYGVMSMTDTKAYKTHLASLLLGETNTYAEDAEKLGLEADSLSRYYNYDDDEYQDAAKVFTDATVTVSHFNSVDYNDDIIIDNTQELREALAKDFENSTWQSRFMPEEKELCLISFTEYYDDDYYYAHDISYKIYPSMTNTVAYLDALGIDYQEDSYFKNIPTSAEVAKVGRFLDWNYTADEVSVSSNNLMQGFVQYREAIDEEAFFESDLFSGDILYKSVTDAAELKELMKASKPYGFTSSDDYVVEYTAVDDAGNQYYQYMIVPGDFF